MRSKSIVGARYSTVKVKPASDKFTLAEGARSSFTHAFPKLAEPTIPKEDHSDNSQTQLKVLKKTPETGSSLAVLGAVGAVLFAVGGALLVSRKHLS